MPDPNPADNEPTDLPVVFVFYHRQDKRQKDLLLAHLDDALDGRAKICAGNAFPRAAEQAESEAQIVREQVVVLLITNTFLTSKQIKETTVPALLDAHMAGEIRILPLVTPECKEKAVAWLTSLGVGLERNATIWRNVFVSYSHADKVYAQRLRRALRRREFFVWMDEDIGIGTKWTRELEIRLNECVALIVILTAHSKDSDWVQDEVAYARERGKPIFPVLFEEQGQELELGIMYVRTQCKIVRSEELPPESFYDQLGSLPQVLGCRLPLPSALLTPPRQKAEPKRKVRLKPWMGIVAALAVIVAFLYPFVIHPAIWPPAPPAPTATSTQLSATRTPEATRSGVATPIAALTPTTTPSVTLTATHTSTPKPSPTRSNTSTLISTPTPTISPTSTRRPTSTPIPTPTPRPPYVIVTGAQNVNLRAGPGTVYESLGVVPPGTELVVVARTWNEEWWWQVDHNDRHVWVYAPRTQLRPTQAAIPTASETPPRPTDTPTATITPIPTNPPQGPSSPTDTHTPRPEPPTKAAD